MAKCPWCGTTIAKFFLDRKCPKCGEQLGDSKSVANATLATIEGDSPQEAIDNLEGKSKSDTIGTVDIEPPLSPSPSVSKDSEATVDISDLDPNVSQNDKGDVRKLSKEATVTGDATVDGIGTVDELGGPQLDSEATIEASSLPKADSDMTLDAPEAMSPPGLNTPGSDQTFGADGYGASSSLYKTSEVNEIWQKAAGSSADPAHSLDKGRVEVTDSVFERISVRNLNLNPNVASDQADYQIRSELGRGKQGVVYAAKQKGLGRTVAIKLVMKGATGSVERDKLSRFVREAEITAALDHPNILPIHELAVTGGGELFYSMKKVDGKAWNDIIDDNLNTLDENVECLLKVCDALAFAHSKKVIHRDLKPGNIMIGGFGEVLVADWGMAVDLGKTENFRPTATQKDPFSFGGTPAYMSPEMAKHDWPRIGTRSDIYLLGAILYHLVEGRPPRDGRTVYEVLERARSNFYFPVEDDSGLMAVALKAMATIPSERYATVEEFQEAIREVNRHAESSRLSEHADKLLDEATTASDYGKFNEAIFSYRNAIDLWRDNKPAQLGLKRARIAYSENALSRGDFDVCLETLDPQQPDEQELYSKAKAAQTEARSRELRYRRLRRVSAIGALIALTVLSGLSLWLGFSIEQVRLARDDAQNSAEKEKTAAAKAKEQEGIAIKEAEDAKKAREEANKQRDIARGETTRANQAVEGLKESNLKLAAETEQKEKQRRLAEEKSVEALLNERIAKLGGYQSSLLSAFNLAQSYNVRRSQTLLSDIRDLQRGLLIPVEQLGEDKTLLDAGMARGLQQAPPLVSWPYRRVAALIGRDIPYLDWGRKDKSAGCLDVAAAAPFAVMGSKQGKQSLLQVVRVENDRIEPINDLELSFERSILSVAISPDAKEVVFIAAGSDKAEPSAFYWDLATKQVSPIENLKNMGFRWTAFSPDGKHFLVGIKTGVYRWSRTEKLQLTQKPVVYRCRGDLRNIQFVESDAEIRRAVCTAMVDVPSKGTKNLACFELDLQSDSLVTLDIPSDLSTEATVATVIDAIGRVCLGTIDGRLLLLDRVGQKGQVVELKVVDELTPNVHQTRILHVRQHGKDALITIAEDNALHLWRRQTSASNSEGNAAATTVEASEWTYERPLVGLPDLAVDGRFYKNGEHVVALDQSGFCVDWDLKKIAARQRMDAPEAASGILISGGEGESGRNWWIDEEGVLRNWGSGVSPQLDSMQFPGHTPRAEFVDLITTEESDRLVTIARLTEKSSPFRSTSDTSLEFCVWEASTGKMLHRWERKSDLAAKALIVGNGQKLLRVNSEFTTICNLDGSSEKVLKNGDQNIGAVDIVPHPTQSNLIALVSARSIVSVLDLAANDSIAVVNREWEFGVTTALTLKAQWNPAGNRLYILRKGTDGGDKALVSLDFQNGQLSAVKEYSDPLQGLQYTNNPDFKHVADLHVGNGPNGEEIVSCAVRFRAENNFNRILSTWFGKATFKEGTPPKVEVQTYPTGVWISPSAQVVNEADVRKMFRTSPNTFLQVSFNSKGNVSAVMELPNAKGFCAATTDPNNDKGESQLYGRTACVAAAGDANGENWLTLHEAGELWMASVGPDGALTWNPIPRSAWAPLGISKIASLTLAPQGKQFTVAGDANGITKIGLINLSDNKLQKSWDGYSLAAWHPNGEQLALGAKEGKVKIVQLSNGQENDGQISIDEIDGKKPGMNRLVWFRENLATLQRGIESRWYVLAQIGERNLQFHSLDNDANAAKFTPIELDARVSAVACSPTDNTIVVGTTSGSVSTWFASPAVDKEPRELFSIDAHRGSILSDIRFSEDGYSLFTADAPEKAKFSNRRGRAYGWLSIRLPEENAEPLANN